MYSLLKYFLFYPCELGREGRVRGLEGKKTIGRNISHFERKALRVYFSPSNKIFFVSELKNCNCIKGGFWKVYMNFLNLTYVVIIFLFLKLKIYQS